MAQVEAEANAINYPPILDEVAAKSDLEIKKYSDHRRYKLQHLAAEFGHLEALNELLRRGVDFDCEVKDKTPADLAFDNKHFNIVLNLLKANFKFPSNYDNEVASDDLKEFVRLSSEIDESIKSEEIVKIEEILKRNSHLKYFYNTENKSAVRVALENKKFKAYEVLLTHHLTKNDDEYINKIIKDFSNAECEKLSKINLKLSKNVLAEPLATLMQNSHFGPDCPNETEYRKFIEEAYSCLLGIPCLKKSLRAVAASKKFKIVFDFKRQYVAYMDPLSEPYANGIFYITGRIYIGAKNMLDPRKKFEVYGVIAHELCHYAMFLAYRNMAKPYKKSDKVRQAEYLEVLEECETNMKQEKIVEDVFKKYSPDMWHAELIVRAPQMMVKYKEKPETLETKKEFFPKLFKYIDSCEPEIEAAIPKINKRFPTDEQKVKRQRLMIFWISILSVCLVSLLGFLAYWFNSQNYSWDTLTPAQKTKVANSTVKYFEVEVKFGELFANNSEVYDSLTAKQIAGALNDDPKKLSNAVMSFDSQIFLNFTTLPVSLKHKLLNSNVTFKGQSIKINKLLTNESSVLNHLENSEIKLILGKTLIPISPNKDLGLKFYIERSFVCDDGSENKTFDDVVSEMSGKKLFLLSDPAGEGKSTTFKNLWFKLKKKFPWKWVEFVDLKEHLEAFKVGNNLDFEIPGVLDNFLRQDLLNLTKLEGEIFTELFQKGHVTFLWDGADEIFPLYKNFMMKLVSNITKLTKNWQFISTRPHYSIDFTEKLIIKAHSLLPLSESEKIEILVKWVINNQLQIMPKVDVNTFYEKFSPYLSSDDVLGNLSSLYFQPFDEKLLQKIIKIIQTGTNILVSIKNSKKLESPVINPLLIRMTAEVADDKEFKFTDKFNSYAFYDSFVNKKAKIASKKGEVVEDDVAKIEENLLNSKKSHHPFGLKLILGDYIEQSINKHELNLTSSFFKTELSKVSAVVFNGITRFGILTVKSHDDFYFDHRTFAEFFVAQYFIYEAENFNGLSSDETKTKIFLLNEILFFYEFKIVRRFVEDYRDSTPINKLPRFFKYLRNSKYELSKLKNITNGKFDLLFHVVYVADFYVNHPTVKVNLDLITYEDRGHSRLKDYERLLNNWENVKLILGNDRTRMFMKIQDAGGKNFIFKFMKAYRFKIDDEEIDLELMEKFLSIYDEFFEIEDFQRRYRNQSLLMFASHELHFESLKTLWNYTKIKFNNNSEGLSKTLLLEDDIHSPLDYGFYITDLNSYLFVLKIYKETIENTTKIKEQILKFNDRNSYFFKNIFSPYRQESEVYWTTLFKNDKKSLRNFLNKSDNANDKTLNEKLLDTKSHQSRMAVKIFFKNYVRKTYGEFEKAMKTSCWLKDYFGNFTRNLHRYESKEIYEYCWNFEDFKFFIDNWEKIETFIGLKEFRSLLTKQEKDHYYFTYGSILLKFFLYADFNEELAKPFFSKLNSTLSSTEKAMILWSKKKDFENPITIAARYCKLNVIEEFWDFMKSNDLDQQKKYFKTDLILKSVLKNDDIKTFQFVIKMYKHFFNDSEMQNILLRENQDYFDNRQSIIHSALEFSSNIEMVNELAKYLQILFKGDQEKLKELFELKDYYGKTALDIETIMKECLHEKFNIMSELYNKVSL